LTLIVYEGDAMLAALVPDLVPLPPSAQEIADVIGRERALFLIGQLPVSGSRSWRRVVYIPRRMPPDHPLVQMMGWHDAERLRLAFGGEILQPANCSNVERAWRDQVIGAMASEGYETAVIAEWVETSANLVRKVLAARNPPEDRPKVAREVRAS
jgi:hypothetical protein